MKNTVMLPLVFVGNFLLWTFIVSLFTVPASYQAIVTLSSRHFAVLLSYAIFIALYLVPISLILSFISLFFYLMRHRTLFYISIPVVLALVALSVIVVIPVSYSFSDRFASADLTRKDAIGGFGGEDSRLYAPGLIREGAFGKRVFWLDSSGAGKRALGVVVADRSAPAGSHAMSVYPSADYDPASAQLSSGGALLFVPAGGRDPLIMSHLEIPGFLANLALDATYLLESFRAAAVRGPYSYYGVVGGFFAFVLSLFLVSRANSWRLLNALLTLACLRFALMGYPYTSTGAAFDMAKRFMPRSIPDDLVSPAIVIAATVLLSLAGLVVFAVRLMRRRGRGASYE